MNHLYSVTSKEGGRTVPFSPNDAQKRLFNALKKHKKIIILKARQLGTTTGTNIWLLDEVLFNRNVNALTIMQAKEHAITAFDTKVQFAWKNISEDLKEHLGWQVSTDRANQLTFSFGDGTSSTYAVANTGRSGTFQYVHISELAALAAERPIDAKEVITGTLPAIPQSGYCIIESTANGELGYFADYWRDAVEGKNGFHPIFFSWRYDTNEIEKCEPVNAGDLPSEFLTLQEKHKFTPKELSYYYSKWRLLSGDWAELRQEYPTTPEEAFMTSQEKLFDTEAVDDYLAQAIDGKVSQNTTVFYPPRPGRTYVIGADPSEGIGGDASAATVWEVDGSRPTVVAQYASDKCPPEDFAYILKELAVLYNDAVIAPESNNHGHAVIAILRRIYDEEKIYRSTDAVSLQTKEAGKLGFNTNSATKPLILHNLSQAIRERSISVPSRGILMEMRILPRQETTRIRAEPEMTRHFDLLMATAIGFHARDFALARSSNNRSKVLTNVVPTHSDIYSAI